MNCNWNFDLINVREWYKKSRILSLTSLSFPWLFTTCLRLLLWFTVYFLVKMQSCFTIFCCLLFTTDVGHSHIMFCKSIHQLESRHTCSKTMNICFNLQIRNLRLAKIDWSVAHRALSMTPPFRLAADSRFRKSFFLSSTYCGLRSTNAFIPSTWAMTSTGDFEPENSLIWIFISFVIRV